MRNSATEGVVLQPLKRREGEPFAGCVSVDQTLFTLSEKRFERMKETLTTQPFPYVVHKPIVDMTREENGTPSGDDEFEKSFWAGYDGSWCGRIAAKLGQCKNGTGRSRPP
jgi:hypothetical protein